MGKFLGNTDKSRYLEKYNFFLLRLLTFNSEITHICIVQFLVCITFKGEAMKDINTKIKQLFLVESGFVYIYCIEIKNLKNRVIKKTENFIQQQKMIELKNV